MPKRKAQLKKLPSQPSNPRIGDVRKGDEIGNKVVRVVLWVSRYKAFFITEGDNTFSIVKYSETPFFFSTVKTVSNKKYSLESIINVLAKKL
jgi:hypothetical protein